MTLPLFGDPDPAPTPKPARPDEKRTPATMAALNGRAEPCRSCGVLIVYATSFRKMRDGTVRTSTAPVELEPAPDGNVLLTFEGRRLLSFVLTKPQRAGRNDLHLNHFATCPDRKAWRKK